MREGGGVCWAPTHCGSQNAKLEGYPRSHEDNCLLCQCVQRFVIQRLKKQRTSNVLKPTHRIVLCRREDRWIGHGSNQIGDGCPQRSQRRHAPLLPPPIPPL